MSRPPHRPSYRLGAALLAGALGISAFAGASTAQATAGVVDLEATILRIGGAAVTGSNPIPSGRTLTPVQLTTSSTAPSPGSGSAAPGSRGRRPSR